MNSGGFDFTAMAGDQYGPLWRPTNEAGGIVKFICNPDDRTGQKYRFEGEFEIRPDKRRAGLADPARQRDLLCSVINLAKPMILEAKPWMCMACDRQACEMVNTPRLDTMTTEPCPVITDLLPLFICAAPACEAEAWQFSERVIKDASRGNKDLTQHLSGLTLRVRVVQHLIDILRASG